MHSAWIILLAIVAALAAAALFTDRFHRDGRVPEAEGGPHIVDPNTAFYATDDPGDGYREDRSDPDAPKTVESTTIIEFDCRFSTLDDAEPGALGNHIYQLWAKLENGAVKGSYALRDTGGETPFRADPGFLAKVYALAAQYDLAQCNGHFAQVMGLPGGYGFDLEIRFASGEKILAADNCDNLLPKGFCEDAAALFARKAGADLPDTGEQE